MVKVKFFNKRVLSEFCCYGSRRNAAVFEGIIWGQKQAKKIDSKRQAQGKPDACMLMRMIH